MRGHRFVKLTFCLRDPPDCWMYWQSLFHINLGSNMLFGEIPDLMGLLFWFQSLYLLNNLLLWGHTSINFQEIYQTASQNGNGSSIKIQWIEWQYLTTNMPTSNILLDPAQYFWKIEYKYYGYIIWCIHYKQLRLIHVSLVNLINFTCIAHASQQDPDRSKEILL